MPTRSLQSKFRDMLLSLFQNPSTNGAKTEVIINCPFCAKDGNPDNGKHFYMSLGLDNKPPMYNCFRNMNHHGLLTAAILEQISDYPTLIDYNLLDDIKEEFKRSYIKSKYTIDTLEFTYNKNLNFNNKINSISDLVDIKKSYICSRLGVDLSIDELCRIKTIFNIKDFLLQNNIQYFTRTPEIMDIFNTYFVGFLNNTNSYIVLRNMVHGKLDLKNDYMNKRYAHYKIIENAISGNYIIPSECNILNHIDIHISEGIFDILSIYYNLRDMNYKNNIYVAMGGNAYLKTVKYFIEDLGLIDIDFHIYIDNDIENKVLSKVKKLTDSLLIDTYIHMNSYSGEKDFGVPKNRISEYIYKL